MQPRFGHEGGKLGSDQGFAESPIAPRIRDGIPPLEGRVGHQAIRVERAQLQQQPAGLRKVGMLLGQCGQQGGAQVARHALPRQVFPQGHHDEFIGLGGWLSQIIIHQRMPAMARCGAQGDLVDGILEEGSLLV